VEIALAGLSMKSYRRNDWIDPRIEIRPSVGRGNGSFAKAPIGAGEIVTIWGGIVGTREDVRSGRIKRGSATAIAEDLVIGAPGGDGSPPSPSHFLNHACDPNVWMRDEVTLIARRDIESGEELTADYAMWECDEDHVMHWTCNCASPLCRRIITGKDWRLADLQARYRGHFSPFINARIAQLSSSSTRYHGNRRAR
jgi:uncharacterized protein